MNKFCWTAMGQNSLEFSIPRYSIPRSCARLSMCGFTPCRRYPGSIALPATQFPAHVQDWVCMSLSSIWKAHRFYTRYTIPRSCARLSMSVYTRCGRENRFYGIIRYSISRSCARLSMYVLILYGRYNRFYARYIIPRSCARRTGGGGAINWLCPGRR